MGTESESLPQDQREQPCLAWGPLTLTYRSDPELREAIKPPSPIPQGSCRESAPVGSAEKQCAKMGVVETTGHHDSAQGSVGQKPGRMRVQGAQGEEAVSVCHRRH